jgi:hypothetical protein
VPFDAAGAQQLAHTDVTRLREKLGPGRRFS